jgi:dihydrofolate reductase
VRRAKAYLSKWGGVVADRSLSALVAVASNGVIGHHGGMPWRLGSDLRRFKQLTMGGVLIMGRKTYQSIGRPLPGRQTIVVTRNRHWAARGVITVADPTAAVVQVGLLAERAQDGMAGHGQGVAGGVAGQGYVVGGAEIYQALLPRCQTLYLTRVLAEPPGDTRLELDLSDFDVVTRESLPISDRDQYPTEFLQLVRRAQPEGAVANRPASDEG